jgi:hypothetical protein
VNERNRAATDIERTIETTQKYNSSSTNRVLLPAGREGWWEGSCGLIGFSQRYGDLKLSRVQL